MPWMTTTVLYILELDWGTLSVEPVQNVYSEKYLNTEA